MSIKKLFEQSKTGEVVGKYLANCAAYTLSGVIESIQHLSESITRRDTFVPPLDYGK